mgnify:CR=1 FL=1
MKKFLKILSLILVYVGIVVACILATSCKTQKEIVKEVPVYIRDTTEKVVERVDSVLVHHYHFEKDTCGTKIITDSVDRWHTKIVHDSVDRIKEVPIEVQVEIIKEVPAEITWWEHGLMRIGGITVILVIIVTIVNLLRKRAKK